MPCAVLSFTNNTVDKEYNQSYFENNQSYFENNQSYWKTIQSYYQNNQSYWKTIQSYQSYNPTMIEVPKKLLLLSSLCQTLSKAFSTLRKAVTTCSLLLKLSMMDWDSLEKVVIGRLLKPD